MSNGASFYALEEKNIENLGSLKTDNKEVDDAMMKCADQILDEDFTYVEKSETSTYGEIEPAKKLFLSASPISDAACIKNGMSLHETMASLSVSDKDSEDSMIYKRREFFGAQNSQTMESVNEANIFVTDEDDEGLSKIFANNYTFPSQS